MREDWGEYRCDNCDMRCLFQVLPVDYDGRRWPFCTDLCGEQALGGYAYRRARQLTRKWPRLSIVT